MNKLKWNTIEWSRRHLKIFEIQKKIYNYSLEKNWNEVKKLQNYLIKSFDCRLLAVRAVTQDNRGKRTAGVDGKSKLTVEERLKLVYGLKINRETDQIRRVYIDRPDGQKRPLGIPTIKDRAKQMLVKMAVEPAFEAISDKTSYGFRPGRSCWDCRIKIRRFIEYGNKTIVDGGIEKCFDELNHKYILQKLDFVTPAIFNQIEVWLQAKVVDLQIVKGFEKEINDSSGKGTPQGGIISPLLMNIALNGLEKEVLLNLPVPSQAKREICLVRYADDFVIIIGGRYQDQQWITKIYSNLQKALNKRGLQLNKEKTVITESSIGFDFLGFSFKTLTMSIHHASLGRWGQMKKKEANIKTAAGYIIKPSRNSIRVHKMKVKSLIKQHRAHSQEVLINKLSLVIKGWTTYYSVCGDEAISVFTKLDFWLWTQLKRWAIKRHSKNVSNRWQYWITHKGRKWVFGLVKGDKTLVLNPYAYQKTRKTILVQENYSPYDGRELYWSKRLSTQRSFTKWNAQILKRQEYKCYASFCRQYFKPWDIIEVHHIIAKKDGGTDALSNLSLIHGHCHDGIDNIEKKTQE